jgi:hypothetical protein
MAELVDAIGADAARQLAQRFGGTSVYVPRAVGEHHPLRVALGVDAVVKLVEWYGGARLSIPKQPERRARVRALRNAGALTIAGIAVETGFSERHVYRLLSEPDDRQSDLFDPN